MRFPSISMEGNLYRDNGDELWKGWVSNGIRWEVLGGRITSVLQVLVFTFSYLFINLQLDMTPPPPDHTGWVHSQTVAN